MVEPGKYMKQPLCLKIYKHVNNFMENILNWKDENKTDEIVRNVSENLLQNSDSENKYDDDLKKKKNLC